LTAADALKKISERESFNLNCDVIYKNIGTKFIEIETFYILISLHFFSGKVEVLLKANTSPIIVVSEAGKSEYEAQESAAYFILAYLKTKLRI